MFENDVERRKNERAHLKIKKSKISFSYSHFKKKFCGIIYVLRFDTKV